MAKWRLFSRTKKDLTIEEKEKCQENFLDESNKQIDNNIEKEYFEEEKPLAEYNETLYSGKPITKKTKTKPATDQRIWRDLDLIEDKIDTLNVKSEKNETSDIEKRVDNIISGVKIKKKPVVSKKVSNIIYVLSLPQAGELKGDWAVERNGEIYSHHKAKNNAIKIARNLAKKKKNGKVMIQNVDGTFNKAFKPAKRKKH